MFHSELANVFKVWADSEDQRGADSSEHRSQAIASYHAAVELDAVHADSWIALGTAYFKRATSPHPRGCRWRPEQARTALERALSIDPGNFVPYFYAGQVHESRARRQYNRGAAASPELEQAIELYRKGVAINGKLPQFHNVLGGALVWKAELTWDDGGDAFPLARSGSGGLRAGPHRGAAASLRLRQPRRGACLAGPVPGPARRGSRSQRARRGEATSRPWRRCLAAPSSG